MPHYFLWNSIRRQQPQQMRICNVQAVSAAYIYAYAGGGAGCMWLQQQQICVEMHRNLKQREKCEKLIRLWGGTHCADVFVAVCVFVCVRAHVACIIVNVKMV